MVAVLSTFKNGIDAGVSFAKETLELGKSALVSGYGIGKSGAKLISHELLDTTVKVIGAASEASHISFQVVAGSVIFDTILNGKMNIDSAKDQGTATYKVLNHLGIKNDFTTDPSLVQSLQIPAAILLATVALPATVKSLDWLKGKVIKLDQAIQG